MAAEGAGEIVVGGARYVANPAGDGCEFAVALADDWHGPGLARHFMELLMAAARERGLRSMEGYILTSNAAMGGLAKRLGFNEQPLPGDAPVCLVQPQLRACRPAEGTHRF